MPELTWPTTHGDVVEVYRGRRRLRPAWRWRVRAGNGEILEGGEPHTERWAAVEAALRHHPRVGAA